MEVAVRDRYGIGCPAGVEYKSGMRDVIVEVAVRDRCGFGCLAGVGCKSTAGYRMDGLRYQ